MSSRAQLARLLLVASLAGCGLPPLQTDLAPRPCAEEVGGEIAFAYRSRGRFLVGRAACDQYFEDVRAVLQSRAALPGPLSPMEAMQIAPAPSAPSAPAGDPTGADRPSPSGFRAMAPLRPIHFDFDTAEIRPADVRVLHDYADWLTAHARYTVLIEGHCDERGTTAYNLALGERRAARVKEYLTERGVEARRILTITYGESRPLCLESSEACWALNRRAEFLFKER